MNNYCDVLWVEDFDSGDTSRLEQKIKDYYSEAYAFRVYAEDKMKMLALLKTLEDEKEFLRYSCVVLDINLNRAFGGTDKEKEFKAIKEILAKNRVRILDEHDPNEEAEDYSEFRINAGYYVYLYLVNRGMPPSRICMLTGNKGENSLTEGGKNLTEGWEEIFKNAGFIPPKAFDKDYELKDFQDWLEKTLTPSVRLRSCIIGMSFYANKLLEDETLKFHVQNLYRIPLHLSENEETASPEFISALWQIVQPYDSKKSFSFGSLENAYQTTLTTTRNWFAHNCLKKSPPCLLTVAFLFGIGMRNLLKKRLAVGGIDVKDKEYRNEYRRWEDELIVLLKFLDGKVLPKIDKITSKLVIESCKEFSDRIKNSRIPLTNDISKIIHEIGQKDRDLERRDTDLLRDFLHGFYPLKEGEFSDNGIKFEFDKKTFNARKNKIEAQYLEAVKNTLALAVYRE